MEEKENGRNEGTRKNGEIKENGRRKRKSNVREKKEKEKGKVKYEKRRKRKKSSKIQKGSRSEHVCSFDPIPSSG